VFGTVNRVLRVLRATGKEVLTHQVKSIADSIAKRKEISKKQKEQKRKRTYVEPILSYC